MTVQIARGSVTDRPWGRTLAALGLRGVTGQLTLLSEGKRFAVAFANGAVVAAVSPLASDAAVRVALTAHLISSSQVPEISRRQAAAPGRDEIALIAELARLGPDHALRLRRRAIAQRAARTFSINQGEFVVTDLIDLPIVAGCELDARAVIYMGARANLSEQRLADELDQLGAWFQLKQGVDDDLPQFGFSDVEQPIIERLRDGGTVAQLEDFAASFVDARTVRAAVYALAVYNACDVEHRASQPLPRVSPSSPAAAAIPSAAVLRSGTQPLPRTIPPPTPDAPRTRPTPAPPASESAGSRTRPMPTALRTPTLPPMPLGSGAHPIDSDDDLEIPGTAAGQAARHRPRMTPVPDDAIPRARRDTPSGVIGEPRRSRSDAAIRLPRDGRGTGSHAALRLPPDEGGRRDGSDSALRPPPEDALRRDRSDAALRLPPDERTGSDVAIRVPRETGAPPLDEAEASPMVVRRRIMASSRPPELRTRSRSDSAQSHEVKALIAQRLKLLDSGADHFQLLGVSTDAPPDGLRRAYFALARRLHPDRLAALGISDDGKHAQRLFAQINAGFAILSDPARRASYLEVQRKGGEAAVRAEQARAEEMTRRILDAEEAFHRGEMALRRDQPAAAVTALEQAIQLNPDEIEYHALLAWARFCASSDKAAAAAATRSALDKAIQRAPKSVPARFYLGRVERMLGRDTEALRHFREVLASAPSHTEAAAEIRVIEARIADGTKPRPKR